jgi:hypothetical protein
MSGLSSIVAPKVLARVIKQPSLGCRRVDDEEEKFQNISDGFLPTFNDSRLICDPWQSYDFFNILNDQIPDDIWNGSYKTF